MTLGYVLVNLGHPDGMVVCGEDSYVYTSRREAEREARRLRREYHNRSIQVYEVAPLGTVCRIGEAEVFEAGAHKGIKKGKLRERMEDIRGAIDAGLGDWRPAVDAAIDAAFPDYRGESP